MSDYWEDLRRAGIVEEGSQDLVPYQDYYQREWEPLIRELYAEAQRTAESRVLRQYQSLFDRLLAQASAAGYQPTSALVTQQQASLTGKEASDAATAATKARLTVEPQAQELRRRAISTYNQWLDAAYQLPENLVNWLITEPIDFITSIIPVTEGTDLSGSVSRSFSSTPTTETTEEAADQEEPSKTETYPSTYWYV